MSSVRDILLVTVLLFVIGVSIVMTVMIGHKVNAKLLENPMMGNFSNATRAVITSADRAINMSDYIYVALFLGFFIGIIISGYLVGGLPIAAPIYFFIVCIFSFVSVLLQMAWGDIALNSEVQLGLANLPITSFILSNLGYFTVVFGLVGIFVMFAKPSDAQGGFYGG